MLVGRNKGGVKSDMPRDSLLSPGPPQQGVGLGGAGLQVCFCIYFTSPLRITPSFAAAVASASDFSFSVHDTHTVTWLLFVSFLCS